MIERQELHCHNCQKYVQFDLDMDLDGNHVLTCPNCGHEHCRVIKAGRITDDRWDQRNGNTYQIPSNGSGTITFTTTSTFNNYANVTTASNNDRYFFYTAWMNTTSST